MTNGSVTIIGLDIKLRAYRTSAHQYIRHEDLNWENKPDLGTRGSPAVGRAYRAYASKAKSAKNVLNRSFRSATQATDSTCKGCHANSVAAKALGQSVPVK